MPETFPFKCAARLPPLLPAPEQGGRREDEFSKWWARWVLKMKMVGALRKVHINQGLKEVSVTNDSYIYFILTSHKHGYLLSSALFCKVVGILRKRLSTISTAFYWFALLFMHQSWSIFNIVRRIEDLIRAWTSIVPFIKHFLDCMAGRVI